MAKTIHEPKKRRSFAIHEPKEKRTVWTDTDVAEFFNISVRTLTRRLDKPLDGELDPNVGNPRKIGGRRFWLRENVERMAGITKGN